MYLDMTFKEIKATAYYQLFKRLLLGSHTLINDHPLRLIETGCGSGICSLVFKSEFPAIEVTLLDRDTQALEVAGQIADREKIEATIIKGDLLNTGFDGGTYDVVWNLGTIEHLEGKARQASFDEAYRICRKGGVYIVIVPNSLNPQWFLKQHQRRNEDRPYQQNFTILELKDRMRASGFTITRTDGTWGTRVEKWLGTGSLTGRLIAACGRK